MWAKVVCRRRMEGLEACAARHVQLSPSSLDELHGILSQVYRGLLVPKVLARVVLSFDFWELIMGVASVLDHESHLLRMIVLVSLWESPTRGHRPRRVETSPHAREGAINH
jgi:hypothetical protein